jgi:hypothetical protein
VFLCRPEGDVHDEPTATLNHRRGSELARLVMRANAGIEH